MSIMRPLGSVLLASGVVVGVGVGIAMLGGVHVLPAVPWIVAVGLTKITLLGSGGLMAVGAICHRLAIRSEQRNALSEQNPSRQGLADD